MWLAGVMLWLMPEMISVWLSVNGVPVTKFFCTVQQALAQLHTKHSLHAAALLAQRLVNSTQLRQALFLWKLARENYKPTKGTDCTCRLSVSDAAYGAELN